MSCHRHVSLALFLPSGLWCHCIHQLPFGSYDIMAMASVLFDIAPITRPCIRYPLSILFQMSSEAACVVISSPDNAHAISGIPLEALDTLPVR
jgi:hypothetical protein